MTPAKPKEAKEVKDNPPKKVLKSFSGFFYFKKNGKDNDTIAFARDLDYVKKNFDNVVVEEKKETLKNP